MPPASRFYEHEARKKVLSAFYRARETTTEYTQAQHPLPYPRLYTMQPLLALGSTLCQLLLAWKGHP
jgi:hypothetical protein